MKNYRLLAASQISLAQVGTLLDLLQHGFWCSRDAGALVAAGVLVEEAEVLEPRDLDELVEFGIISDGHVFTGISDAGDIHSAAPGASVRTYDLNSTVEQVRNDQLADASGVFDGTCCSTPNVQRQYRLNTFGTKGFERANCTSCKEVMERPCPHARTSTNTLLEITGCRLCGMEL